MARREPIPPDELAICRRLREFRLSTMIPRTAFAVAVGISSDRLSEYENGRVPVPFAVFKAINREFYVNPRWLVKGVLPMAFEAPLDIGGVLDRDRDLLSTCYEQVLSQEVTRRQEQRILTMLGPHGLVKQVEEYVSLIEAPGGHDFASVEDVETMVSRLSTLLKALLVHRTKAKQKTVRP